MSDKTHSQQAVSVRLPVAVLERADALAEQLTNSPTPTMVTLLGGSVTRAAVLRLAILRGLEVIEAEDGPWRLGAR